MLLRPLCCRRLVGRLAACLGYLLALVCRLAHHLCRVFARRRPRRHPGLPTPTSGSHGILFLTGVLCLSLSGVLVTKSLMFRVPTVSEEIEGAPWTVAWGSKENDSDAQSNEKKYTIKPETQLRQNKKQNEKNSTQIQHPRICINSNSNRIKGDRDDKSRDTKDEENKEQDNFSKKAEKNNAPETSPLTWVMFMGDSNMRNTYCWWTSNMPKNNRNQSLKGIKGSTYGLGRADLDFGERWADQEILFPPGITEQKSKSVPVVRYSFRFLHGSVEEFVNDANDWDIARRGAPKPKAAEVAIFLNKTNEVIDDGDEKNENKSHQENENKSHMDHPRTGNEGGNDDDGNDLLWKGRIKPSDFARWATKHQQIIDNHSTDFSSWMEKWEMKVSPDVVILTQGWGGVPRSNELAIFRNVLKNNPETLFVWSPIYVTDRTPDRYESYVKSGVFSWSEPNLRMVDLWHLAKNLPKPGRGLYHAPVGGEYMRHAMDAIWKEVSICTKDGVVNRTPATP